MHRGFQNRDLLPWRSELSAISRTEAKTSSNTGTSQGQRSKRLLSRFDSINCKQKKGGWPAIEAQNMANSLETNSTASPSFCPSGHGKSMHYLEPASTWCAWPHAPGALGKLGNSPNLATIPSSQTVSTLPRGSGHCLACGPSMAHGIILSSSAKAPIGRTRNSVNLEQASFLS